LHLIQSLKAQIVSTPSDIANSLGWETLDAPKSIQPKLFLDLTPNEKRVVDLLKASENGILIDALTNAMQLSHSAIAGLIFELEIKNVVKVLPGKRYMLVSG
jgi:DNA processing protein